MDQTNVLRKRTKLSLTLIFLAALLLPCCVHVDEVERSALISTCTDCCPNCGHVRKKDPLAIPMLNCPQCGILCQPELWQNASQLTGKLVDRILFAIVAYDSVQYADALGTPSVIKLFASYANARSFQQFEHAKRWTKLLEEGIHNDLILDCFQAMKTGGVSIVDRPSKIDVDSLIDFIEQGSYFNAQVQKKTFVRHNIELVQIHAIEDLGGPKTNKRTVGVNAHFALGETFQNTTHPSGLPLVAYAQASKNDAEKLEANIFARVVIADDPVNGLAFDPHWTSIVSFPPDMVAKLTESLAEQKIDPIEFKNYKEILTYKRLAEQIAGAEFVQLTKMQSMLVE